MLTLNKRNLEGIKIEIVTEYNKRRQGKRKKERRCVPEKKCTWGQPHAPPEISEPTNKKCNQNCIDIRGIKIHQLILKIIARA